MSHDPTGRSKPTTGDVVLDPWHAAAVEAACAGDRERVAAGERSFLRLLEPHELCLPDACVDWDATMVLVTALGPGLRSRQPIRAAEGSA